MDRGRRSGTDAITITPDPNSQERWLANRDEIVAAHDGSEPREERRIPVLDSAGDGPRNHKGRRCKKLHTEEGCAYGDTGTFLDDEQSRACESVAVSVGPMIGGGSSGDGGGGSSPKPLNWRTRICNKRDTMGFCPYGSKCRFAHGLAELHRHGGGLADRDARDSYSAVPDKKQAGTTAFKTLSDSAINYSSSVPHTNIYHMGPPSQRSIDFNQRPTQRPPQRWKGPDKISRIYGDWIDDNE